MVRVSTVLLALLGAACGVQPPQGAPAQPSQEVATEAHVDISDAELANLRRRAEAGDLPAIEILINFYHINHGDQDPDGIYWELQAARRGDCERWRDLMFMEESGFAVPRSFFVERETLAGIGEAHECPPYMPQLQ